MGQRARREQGAREGLRGVLGGGPGVGEQSLVRVEADLGTRRGGARGRQQQERRVGAHLHGQRVAPGPPLQHLGHGLRALARHVPRDQHRAQTRQRLPQRRSGERAPALLGARRQDDGGGSDPLQQGPDIRGRVALVHGHRDRADRGRGQMERQVLPAVGQVQGHHVAGDHPRLLEAARQRVHRGPPGVPGQGVLPVDQGHGVAAVPHGLGEHPGQGQPVQGPAGGAGRIGHVVVCVDGHHHSWMSSVAVEGGGTVPGCSHPARVFPRDPAVAVRVRPGRAGPLGEVTVCGYDSAPAYRATGGRGGGPAPYGVPRWPGHRGIAEVTRAGRGPSGLPGTDGLPGPRRGPRRVPPGRGTRC